MHEAQKVKQALDTYPETQDFICVESAEEEGLRGGGGGDHITGISGPPEESIQPAIPWLLRLGLAPRLAPHDLST